MKLLTKLEMLKAESEEFIRISDELRPRLGS